MADALDQIVNVSIDIADTPTDSKSFNHLLLLGNAPANNLEDGAGFRIYESLDALSAAGYTPDEGVYRAANVAFAASPPPNKIFVAAYADVGLATSISPTDQTGVQTAVTNALDAAEENGGWYCVCPVYTLDDAESLAEGITTETVTGQQVLDAIHQTVSDWANARDYLCAIPYNDAANEVLPTGSAHTFCIYTGGETVVAEKPANEFIHVAYAARFLSYQAGSEMWENKSLGGVSAYTVGATEKDALAEMGVSYYMTVAGVNIVRGGQMLADGGAAGEWIDIIRFLHWLKNDMKIRIFNLMTANTKLPFTDVGILLVRNQMEASLRQGQVYGGISPDEYYENGDLNPGYTVSVPLAANITAAKKKMRKLEDCTFRARIAGAIRIVEVRGTLQYNNLEVA
jgi:hypothetical protein